MTTRQSKLLGGLLGGAVGDAMGAATETRTTELIKERFGGLVKDIVAPPCDTYAHGQPAGLVTDDFSIAYYTAEDVAAAGGQITREIAIQSLFRWAEHPEYIRYGGPTTRASIAKLKGLPVEKTKYDYILCENRKATNGAAMKSGIMGLFNPGNVDKAIDDAIIMCMITHDNTIALSGACAVAAATAKAMEEGISYYDVITAGLYGAREGFRRSEKIARPVAGASVEKRMQLAVEIGLKYQGDFERAMEEVRDITGTSLLASEAIPAAFGFFAACKGETMDSIYMPVNAGDDTDTVAIMDGFMAGALRGADAIPARYLKLIDSVNHFDLTKLAMDIDALLQ